MTVPRTACEHGGHIHVDFRLPCDVRVPPNTVIRAGCSLKTLLVALELEGRPKHFGDKSELISEAELHKLRLINPHLASADTLPKGQDAQQGLAGTESGAVPAGQTPNPDHLHHSSTTPGSGEE